MIWKTRPRSDVQGLSAIEAGSGRAVLLLHGVGLCSDAWSSQIDAFGAKYHVVAPDMPGHGGSPMLEHVNVLADYTQAYLPLLEKFEEPALVVGHSMGAMIAVDLANKLPNKISAIALLNSVFERDEVASEAVKSRANELDGVTNPDPGPTLMRWFSDKQSDERTACERWLNVVDPAAYKAAYSVFAHSEIPSRKKLEELVCPAVFATGSLEPNSTPEMSRTMAEITPNGRAHVVEGAAHMMPMTHVTEINALLLNFADEVLR